MQLVGDGHRFLDPLAMQPDINYLHYVKLVQEMFLLPFTSYHLALQGKCPKLLIWAPSVNRVFIIDWCLSCVGLLIHASIRLY